MPRIIINNHQSGISDGQALACVQSVVSGGRISQRGDVYCFATMFPAAGVKVFADRTDSGTDTFLVQDLETK